MSAESFLSSVVEAAIGLAGFAGIIAAIRQGSVTRWPHAQRLLLRMLLTASAFAIVFALLPSLLAEARLPEPTIWRSGSALLFVALAALAIRRTLQFRSGGSAAPFPRILWAWIGTVLSLQAVNLFLAAPWPYLIGVFGFLGNGFLFFLRLLFGTPEEAGEPSPRPD